MQINQRAHKGKRNKNKKKKDPKQKRAIKQVQRHKGSHKEENVSDNKINNGPRDTLKLTFLENMLQAQIQDLRDKALIFKFQNLNFPLNELKDLIYHDWEGFNKFLT